MIKILLVEDDHEMSELIREYLKKYDIAVTCLDEGAEVLTHLDQGGFSLVVLDLGLPDRDGMEICRIIREKSALPIIISSARGELSDKVLGLEMGADDYLAKPYDPRELVARIKARLRGKLKEETGSTLVLDDGIFDAYLDGERIHLSMSEYHILKYLAQRPKKAISREELLENVPSLRYESLNRTVDVHISKIRQKLKTKAQSPEYIKSVWGVGYTFIEQ